MVILSDFVPKRRLVSGVTNAFEAVVTTTEDHGYETGLVVRLFVPSSYGMAIYEQGKINVLSDTSFSVTIDTTNLEVFSAPTFPPTGFTSAQVIPISGATNNQAN